MERKERKRANVGGKISRGKVASNLAGSYCAAEIAIRSAGRPASSVGSDLGHGRIERGEKKALAGQKPSEYSTYVLECVAIGN